MSQPLFQYTSIVVDDLDTSTAGFAAIGLVPVWEGRHPHFATEAKLLATQRGGVLCLASGPDADDRVKRRAATPERWFHIALSVPPGTIERLRGTPDVSLTDPYDGPLGRAVTAALITDGGEMLVELYEGDVTTGAPDSSFVRIESTASVSADRATSAAAFESLGLRANPENDAHFPTLDCDNRIALLDWHYIEFADPTGPGVMQSLLERLGGPGIFGINLEPRDMSEFVATAKRHQVRLNSTKPEVLPVVFHGTDMACADIITINPRSLGGRIFVLAPLDYPWKVKR
jgi:hypothetical protein